MIDSHEMYRIYWRAIRARAIPDVERLLGLVTSHHGRIYWGEVLNYLKVRKNGKGSLN